MKKKTKSEKKLENLAETCTGLITTAGVSDEDALAIILNMLKYHSSLMMDTATHEAFIDGLKSLLRLTFVSNMHDDGMNIHLNGESQMTNRRKIGKPADIPDDPKAHYSLTGEWRGWRDFLGVPADSPICDECGNHPCECAMDAAAKESSK